MKGELILNNMETNYMNLKDTLTRLLNSNDTVFIISHDRPDFDALGASIGMAFICEKMKKKPYIIISEEFKDMDKSTSTVVGDMKNRFNVIRKEEIESYKGNDNLLIVLDTNKEYMISVNSKDFDDVIVIDHHSQDDKTIKNAYKFIEVGVSSTCEIVEGLIGQFKVKYDPKYYASYLLAGIELDTKGYDKNATDKTHDAASRLLRAGADKSYVKELFAEDFAKDRAIQMLVSETKIFDFSLAVACQNSSLDVTYTREDLAKAADYMLKFNTDATFAIGRIDGENFYISARSNGLLNVGNIMSVFSNGGGNAHSAAAKIPAILSLEELQSTIIDYLKPGYSEGIKEDKVKKLKL